MVNLELARGTGDKAEKKTLGPFMCIYLDGPSITDAYGNPLSVLAFGQWMVDGEVWEELTIVSVGASSASVDMKIGTVEPGSTVVGAKIGSIG